MREKWLKVVKFKKWIVIGLAILIAVPTGYIYFKGSGTKAAASPRQIVSAERGDISTVVSATGSITPVDMVDISSKITAQIKEVLVKENEPVKAGQTLVILEDSGLQAQVTQVKERLNNASVKYERTERLHSIGAASKEQLDDSSMEYNIAKASYDQVMSNLNETVVTSPIDGSVIGKPLSAGEMVAQGVSNPTVILTVADMSKMQIAAQVDQTDIGKVAIGQKVRFTVDAYPGKQFTGIVSTISRKPVVQQNVTYYPVTIDVADAENKLNPGMVARVSIFISEKNGIVNLPLAAIRSDKEGKYVIVPTQNGQTQKVSVTTGTISEDRIEIVSGLNEGDKVLVEAPKTQGQSGNTQQGGQRGSQQGGPGGNPLSMMRTM